MEATSTLTTPPSKARELREEKNEQGRGSEEDGGDRIDLGRKALPDRRVDLHRQRADARCRKEVRHDELIERNREGEKRRRRDARPEQRQRDREEGMNRR